MENAIIIAKDNSLMQQWVCQRNYFLKTGTKNSVTVYLLASPKDSKSYLILLINLKKCSITLVVGYNMNRNAEAQFTQVFANCLIKLAGAKQAKTQLNLILLTRSPPL